MPQRCPAIVPALGLLAFASFLLPSITAAQAEQCVTVGNPPFCGTPTNCPAGLYLKERVIVGGACVDGGEQIICCNKGKTYNTKSGSVNPCVDMGFGPNYEYVQPSGQDGKCVPRKRPVKHLRSTKSAACEAQGKRYDPVRGCVGMKRLGDKSALRSACHNQNWFWDEQAQKCRKPSHMQADCEARGPRFHYDLDTGRCAKRARISEEQNADEAFDDEEFQPRKKKRKHKRQLDIDLDF